MTTIASLDIVEYKKLGSNATHIKIDFAGHAVGSEGIEMVISTPFSS